MALPITVIILVERVAIVRIAFGGKQFPWSATLLTARTLAFLTPAIVSQALIAIYVRAFYAIHDTKTPLKISMISLISTFLSSYYLINFTSMGVLGLAISASIGSVVQLVGLVAIFIGKVDGVDWFIVGKKTLKIIFAGTLMGLFTWFLQRSLDLFVLDTTRTINLITLTGMVSIFGLISYILASKILKIDELHDYRRYLSKFKTFFNF